MKTNRTSAAIIAVIAVITVGIGVFLLNNSGGSTASTAASTTQSITVKARDTNGAPLNGVNVQLNGAGNIEVASATVTTGGQVSLSFDPEPGMYVVTATEPTGYRARDDKDSGVSDANGLACDNVYLCIYLTATEVQDATGAKSIVVTLTHVRAEQVDELDDLWFEMTPPAAPADEEPVIDTDDAEDILIGGPVVEQIAEEDVDLVTPQPGLAQLCINTRHDAVIDQNAASGIWVRGEIYGLASGWIFVSGSSINGGEPVQIPVEEGTFEGPLGINRYGDHSIDRFELRSDDPTFTPVDLVPALTEGPGTVFPVDANEGPTFDSECFDFEPQPTDELNPSATDDASQPSPDEQAATAKVDAEARVEAFLIGFVENHVTADTDALLDTLHPAIPLAFGDQVCSEYVAQTTGSINGARVLDVNVPQSVDMDTPNGQITFLDAIPFSVEFSLRDGTTTVADATLAQHDGSARWLTRCGIDG